VSKKRRQQKKRERNQRRIKRRNSERQRKDKDFHEAFLATVEKTGIRGADRAHDRKRKGISSGNTEATCQVAVSSVRSPKYRMGR
jgi:hypothetical protein